MLTTDVFELLQQFYYATEIGRPNAANAVSACPDQPQQTKEMQLFRIKWTIAEHNRKHVEPSRWKVCKKWWDGFCTQAITQIPTET